MVVLYSPKYYYIAISNLNSENPSTASSTAPIHKTIRDLSNNIASDIAVVDNDTAAIMSQVSALATDIAAARLITPNEDKLRTSIGMYDDSQNLYITKLLENYLLFISICGIGYGIYNSNKSG